MPEQKQDSKEELVRNSKKSIKKDKKRAGGLSRFMSETKAELKKIVWPTPKQVLNNTVVVLIMIIVVGVFIWCLDALTSNGINALLKAF